MKVAIILNGISLEKKYFYHEVLPALQSMHDVHVFETRSRNDAVTLASKAVDKQFDIILAAGGDGTVHQVVNGVLDGRAEYKDLPVLGVCPVGTGNDFARSLNVAPGAASIVQMVERLRIAPIDVGVVMYTDDSGAACRRYFVNVADAGMGPEVVRRVMASDRPLGAAVAYYMAIVATFITYKPVPVSVKTPTWEWRGKLRTLGVANGKYYGHGLCIAPDAKPDDGIFHTFISGNVSVFDFIRYSGELKKGRHLRIPDVFYDKAEVVEITSQSPCAIEADGEWLGWLPARIEMSTIKLKFLVP